MAERVFLHVGTPKSGTTYLQSVLWRNADDLRQRGLLLPGRFETHYAAAKSITSRSGSLKSTKVSLAKAWPRLVRQLNNWDGDGLVSHELLAPATPDQAKVAIAELNASEVHVIVTARPIYKQLPASWQEQVKGGLSTPFDLFLERVRDEEARGEWFWDVQDVAGIAQRWGTDLPPERVHIVTVPAHGEDPTELWRRYASVLGIEPDGLAATTWHKRNVSLGPVESELLRRVHGRMDGRFRDGQRHRWTRRLLAVEMLGQRERAPIAFPDEASQWLSSRGDQMLDTIKAAGFDVVGALDDLRWQANPPGARLVSTVTDDEVDEASAWTIARLQEHWIGLEPRQAPPPVGADDGVDGILELLEHIRAAHTGAEPREQELLTPAWPVRKLRQLRWALGRRVSPSTRAFVRRSSPGALLRKLTRG